MTNPGKFPVFCLFSPLFSGQNKSTEEKSSSVLLHMREQRKSSVFLFGTAASHGAGGTASPAGAGALPFFSVINPFGDDGDKNDRHNGRHNDGGPIHKALPLSDVFYFICSFVVSFLFLRTRR